MTIQANYKIIKKKSYLLPPKSKLFVILNRASNGARICRGVKKKSLCHRRCRWLISVVLGVFKRWWWCRELKIFGLVSKVKLRDLARIIAESAVAKN